MLTIAYGANLSSWDPTTGLSSLNPQIQSFYKAVFDSFIGQVLIGVYVPAYLSIGDGTTIDPRFR